MTPKLVKIIFQLIWILAIHIFLTGCTKYSKEISAATSAQQPSQAPIIVVNESSRFTLTNIILPTRTMTRTPRPTYKPSFTKTVTVKTTRTPTYTSTLTPVPTRSTADFPQKTVLIEYSLNSGLSIYMGEIGATISNFVLYTDGQFLIQKRYGRPIFETHLSDKQMCSILKKINALGFFEIESDGTMKPGDPLYNFGENYQEVYDAGYFIVTVNGNNPKRIFVYQPYLEFAVQPMQDVLKYLQNFSVVDMNHYQPDRLLLWTTPGRIFESEDTLPAPGLPWLDKRITLQTHDTKVMYFEGDSARKLYDLFGYPYNSKIFTENDTEYTVVARPILPHETRFALQGGVESEEFPLPFNCNW